MSKDNKLSTYNIDDIIVFFKIKKIIKFIQKEIKINTSLKKNSYKDL